MTKLPSYEELQNKIKRLENELSSLKAGKEKVSTTNIDYHSFYKICEYSRNAIVLFESDNNGKQFSIKYLNKKAEEIERIDRNKIIGKYLSEEFPLAKKSGFLDSLQRVFNSNIPEEFPAIVFSYGKIVEWKHNYIYKLSDNEVVSIYVDETEQRKKEYELNEHREKLRIAMDAASYFSFEIDLRNEQIKTNKELYVTLGYSNDELMDFMQNTGTLIHPEDFKKAKKLISKHSKGFKASLNLEYRAKNKSQKWIWFRANGKIVEWDENSKPLKLVGMTRIIQEEREMLIKLQESENRLKLAMESANQVLIDWNIKENKIYYSPEWYKMLGYSPEETKQTYEFSVSLVHPDDVPAAIKKLETHITGETETFVVEARTKTKSGAWKWILTHGKIIKRDWDGTPVRAIGIQTDITNIKNTDQKLKESEEKFKSLATLLPEVVYETDINGNITFVNFKAFEIFEYDPQDLKKGLNITQMLAPENLERAKKNIEKVLKTGNVTGEEYVAITKTGRRFPILVYSNIIKDGNKVKGLRGIIVNITELKKTQEQLRISEENFRQLSENINDAFWLHSQEEKIVYANPACYTIVGDKFKEIFENFESYYLWIHPEDRERIVKQRELNLKHQNKIHFYEHRIIKPDGEIGWLWIRTFPVFNSKGKLYRRAGIASDITKQKTLLLDLLKAKEKAEESDKLKSAFLANMSHEIRTPMNGILGFAELLKDTDITEQEKTEFLNIIDSNGEQLLNLINDIIDIAKIEAGQLSINKSSYNLNSILEEIYGLFNEEQKRLNKTNIKFNLNTVASKDCLIYTDAFRLKQILSNLLSNSFKFTDHGIIEFGYNVIHNNNQEYYRFYVSDSGIGIHSSKHDLIFERFGQVHPNKYKYQQGTGLGLAISKGLVELLNGKIWFESTPENIAENIKGKSIFYFTIPITTNLSSNKERIDNLNPKSEMKKFENVNILVVEDDNDNLEFLKRLLQKYGAHVIIARTGEDAIEAVKSKPEIKIVLMDIRLPDINGFETTKEIKKLNPKLPVIAQTAYAMYNDREICLENGCDDYMSKPLDKDILFQKINHYIYN